MGFPDLRLSKGQPFYMTSGFLFPKSKAPWICRFDRKVRQVVEVGIIDYGIRKFVPQKSLDLLRSLGVKKKKAASKPRAFGFQHIQGTLLILWFGLLGAGFAFLSQKLF